MKVTRAFAFVRLVVVICGLGVALLGTAKTTAAQEVIDDECFEVNTYCDVEGVSWIVYSSDPSQTDDGSSTTINDPDLEAEGFTAFADSLLTNLTTGATAEVQAYDDGTGLAYADIGAAITNRNVYDVSGDHEIVDNNTDCELDPNCGQVFDVGLSEVDLSTFAPGITSITPAYGYVGTIVGSIVVEGDDLVDPFTGALSLSSSPAVTGLTVTGVSFSVIALTSTGFQEEVQIDYQLSQCATTGNITFEFTTTFGTGGSDQSFTIGDPTPIIDSVSPSVWQAGTNVPITVQGSGFGTNPIFSVAGTGVSILSGTVLVSDTQITATVSIASNAPNQTAPIQVQSQGYCGSGFVPANGNSSIATSSAQVAATPAPQPSIYLYATTNNITNQTTTMYSGQQIALIAVVTLSSGVTIQKQNWSTPEGTPIGGYTNGSGTAPCLLATNCPQPDSMSGGQVLLLPSNTGANCAPSNPPPNTFYSCFTFYWVDLGNARQITYSYTASNGSPNSATTTFNVEGPTNSLLTAQTSTVNILPAGQSEFLGAPGLEFGFYPNSPPGIDFTASATLPSGNQGAYSYVQLVGKDTGKYVFSPPANSQTCVPSGFVTSSSPELDNTYPYHMFNPPDSTLDAPAQEPLPQEGEAARSFSANMYLVWTPSADSRCPSGNACTIPVPLGSVSWQYFADATNTLANQTNGTTWLPSEGQGQYPGLGSANPFQPVNLAAFPYGYPMWTTTSLNTDVGGKYVNKDTGAPCGQ